ncbi:MAG: SDR family NAD(P)-dependent oxidoreductase [Acidobacteria bacterium]|nr:SDR family NAD(P)-dependent oxidoreductase [Acidobacteriota bacterium]
MLLRDRVVVVTGAGSGIGRGICAALAAEGAAVVATDLVAEAATETADSVAAGGGRALALVMDVTAPEDVATVIAEAADRLAAIDGWVNNAGVLRLGPALTSAPTDTSLQLEVNVEALLGCSQLVARHMIEHGRTGAIVNVASNAGKVGYPNMAAYNASKAAVISLTRSLAAEWAEHGINVNAVCPGGVDTPMLSEVTRWVAGESGGDPDELRAQMVPAQLGRHVSPLEVGRVVAFLLSDRARIIRGQAINVDGGDTPY